MATCQYFKDCEFVLRYIPQVKPHWDDFVTLYCHGDFQDICKRLEWIDQHDCKPAPELMPNGEKVSHILSEH